MALYAVEPQYVWEVEMAGAPCGTPADEGLEALSPDRQEEEGGRSPSGGGSDMTTSFARTHNETHVQSRTFRVRKQTNASMWDLHKCIEGNEAKGRGD